MGHKMLIAPLAVSCLFFVGCSHLTVVKGPGFESSAGMSYMILPFGDANESRFRLKYPNAASTVRDAFESAFLEKGFDIIPCPEERTSEALLEKKLSATGELIIEKLSDSVEKQNAAVEARSLVGKEGITIKRGIEIGKRADADIVLLGTVTAFYRGWFAGDYTTVGFSVRAINVKTSKIVWKASLIQSTKWLYDYAPSKYAQEIAKRLVKELVVCPAQ